MKKKTVAVTGASGFIGSVVLEKLGKKGYKTLDLSRHNSVDLLVPEQIESALKHDRPDVILHIAGAKKSPYDVNIYGTMNLINISKKLGIKRFIFISTTHVYDSRNEYAQSKLIAEYICKSAYPDCLILRVGSVYGDNKFPFSIGKIMLVSSDFKRNFIKVDDVAEKIIRAMEQNRKGIQDIISDTKISFNQLAKSNNLKQIPVLNYMIEKRDDSR
jgi:UDP-glucose 4-epimerase